MGMAILAWNKNSTQYLGLVLSVIGSLIPIVGVTAYYIERLYILKEVRRLVVRVLRTEPTLISDSG
jgi:hypothetical protein